MLCVVLHFIGVLLPLQLVPLLGCSTLLLLGLVLLLHEGVIDDRKHQVEQEERANEDQGHKIKEHGICVGLLVHHLDVTPTFQGDALKHDKQGPKDIVEVSDLVIGIDIHFATEETLRTNVATTADVWLSIFSFQLSSSLIVDASLLEHTAEEIHSCNGKDDVEEDQNNDGGLESGQGGQHRLDQNPESFNACHCT